eukprot:Blabericola_migrator_1__882@NODE_1216_length_5096_cov_101_127660_g825_i0_p2_GENE_NODE_1216_length_5096_cov_101_127660_g825_i0NODE_1216_length_5096_cov_101_127660_g825_i0_p2_ORF_typecomplete_len126_score21_88Ribosomal_L28e/PF01778_17/1_5e11DUF3617/PF12276_8/0_035_NODE_1216_length_5096_cov_101_127660_g825_i045794956
MVQSSNTLPNASNDLLWLCVKQNNAYLRKSLGLSLSAEKANLTNEHNQRTSGLLLDSVSVYNDGRKIRACVTRENVRKPRCRVQRMKLSTQPGCEKSKTNVEKLIAARPDLKEDIMRKIEALKHA